MDQKRLSAEQIVSKLREADVLLGQGLTVAVVCKHLKITDKTTSRRYWANANLQSSDAAARCELGSIFILIFMGSIFR